MRKILWSICELMYIYVVKPILFLVSPDSVHSGMIKLMSFLGRFAVARGFIRVIFIKKRDKRLMQNYHGIKFYNPVGLSAGFDKNGEILPMMTAIGFGFETVGSITAKRSKGNSRPWFYRLPKTKSIVVNSGLANEGSKKIIERMRKYTVKSIQQFPVVLSVAKTNSKNVVSTKDGINDYINTIERVKNESIVKIIELNISCPNAYDGEPFTIPKRLDKLLTAVDAVGTLQPIYIKMPIDLSWHDFNDLLEVIIRHNVSGVTISNLVKNRDHVNIQDYLPDTLEGNLSGRPTWQTGNELIRQTYLSYGDKLKIIGVGGIFTANDAYTKIKLGSSLVGVLTGLIYNGPQLVAQINDGLVELLEKDGYENINQAVGADARKSLVTE